MFDVKIIRFIAHLGGWLLFFSLPLFFMNSQHNGRDFISILHSANYWIFCGTFLVLFYLLTEVLIPAFYLKRKLVPFFGIVLLLFAGVYWLKPFDRLMSGHRSEHPAEAMPPPAPEDEPPFNPPPEHRPEHRSPDDAIDIMSIFLFIMVVAVAMAINITRQWYLSRQHALQAEADHAEARLSFLKAQINPHFLFNTLNNIYSMAATAHPNTAESILKLSNIMRYVTDETSRKLVPLEEELNCIADFIGLQQLRLGGGTPVEFTVTGTVAGHRIAPLLLMTFVENAFKYGISKQHPAPILILLSVEPAAITFFCQNRLLPQKNVLHSSGVGIENVQQRLRYLYPGSHDLHMSQENELFTVRLILYLQ